MEMRCLPLQVCEWGLDKLVSNPWWRRILQPQGLCEEVSRFRDPWLSPWFSTLGSAWPGFVAYVGLSSRLEPPSWPLAGEAGLTATPTTPVWALILRYSLHLCQEQVLRLSAWLKPDMLASHPLG